MISRLDDMLAQVDRMASASRQTARRYLRISKS